jgi:hypothetical protein
MRAGQRYVECYFADVYASGSNADDAGPCPVANARLHGGWLQPNSPHHDLAASLRYTTDGSTPTCATGTPLAMNPSAVPTFTTSMIFNAIACKVGYAPSPVAQLVYEIDLPLLDGAAPADGGAADAPLE